MKWADYEVGRRVVCISDLSYALPYCTLVPQKGQIYTIKATTTGQDCSGEWLLGLRFQEFESYEVKGCGVSSRDGFWWFQAADFKPLDEARLDQFRKMLNATRWQLETAP